MFTGLIETTATVRHIQRLGGDIKITLYIPDFFSQQEAIRLGDSIAVNGVCLTVVAINDKQTCFDFDVSNESLAHTLITQWRTQQIVNVEQALLANARLGGHLVTGHVDGIAQLVFLQKDARATRLRFSVPVKYHKYIAEKGSITLDGISLTVNHWVENAFEVTIVPHTLEKTHLHRLKVQDKVHFEIDVVARYLERLLQSRDASSLTDKLHLL